MTRSTLEGRAEASQIDRFLPGIASRRLPASRASPTEPNTGHGGQIDVGLRA